MIWDSLRHRRIVHKKKSKKYSLIVSPQAIKDFSRLTTEQRLRWLDETRAFLSEVLPTQTKKIYDSNRSA